MKLNLSTDRFVTCVCGKRGYEHRRAARAVRRRMNGEHLHVYACLDSDLFHVGHMSPNATRIRYREGATP